MTHLCKKKTRGFKSALSHIDKGSQGSPIRPIRDYLGLLRLIGLNRLSLHIGFSGLVD